MSSEFIGTVNATRPKYEKGASDLTIRSRYLLARLRQLGRILFNQSGEEVRWQVKYSEPSVETFGEGGTMDFSNHDSLRKLSCDWRGYKATDSLGLKSSMMNSGDEALLKLFNTKQENLRSAISNALCGELYKDGEATGRGDAIHGLETFMGSGTTVAGDIVAQPSDTYGLGALSTALGNQGGTWSSTAGLTAPNAAVAKDWPYGQGDSKFDFLSPKLVNWSSTAWGTGSSTAWEDNCWRAISTLTTFLTTTNGPDGKPDVLVLAPNLLDGYKNHHEVIRRIDIPHAAANDLGFKGTMNQNGVAIEPDFDCPANTGYMMNLNKMELRSLYKELFWMKGPDIDPHSAYSYLWAFGFFGNCTFSPKHFGKLFNFA